MDNIVQSKIQDHLGQFKTRIVDCRSPEDSSAVAGAARLPILLYCLGYWLG
jgi:hypothetical protein